MTLEMIPAMISAAIRLGIGWTPQEEGPTLRGGTSGLALRLCLRCQAQSVP